MARVKPRTQVSKSDETNRQVSRVETDESLRGNFPPRVAKPFGCRDSRRRKCGVSVTLRLPIQKITELRQQAGVQSISKSPSEHMQKVRSSALEERSQHSLRVNPEPFHARDQRRALEIQACCGTVRARHSPVRDFQDADDLVAFVRIASARHRGMSSILAEFCNWNLQCRPPREDHRTLDEIFQLTNISRPMPGRESVDGFGRNGFDLLLHAAAVLLSEVSDQQGNILRTFAQRRDADRKHV